MASTTRVVLAASTLAMAAMIVASAYAVGRHARWSIDYRHYDNGGCALYYDENGFSGYYECYLDDVYYTNLYD